MGFFRPQTARHLAESLTEICKNWDNMPEKKRKQGCYINPDEPVVLHVPNPEWEGEEGEWCDDEFGNPRQISFHVESHGGGADVDEDGNECGHDGVAIGGMEIDPDKFLCNGRRLGKTARAK